MPVALPQTPTWDLVIAMLFLVGLAYGFILQREKIIATILSVYVALVLVAVLSGDISAFFAGDKTLFNQFFIKSNASPFTIKTIIFLGTVILLSSRGGFSGEGGRGLLSPLEIGAYSFLNTALILSSIFSFMPEAQRQLFVESSRLARMVIEKQIWWLLLPIVLMIVIGWRRRSI